MTSIVGVTALQEFRKFKGFETSVIAGGFCRDSLMGANFKDLDICIPCKSQEDFKSKVFQHFTKTDPAEPFYAEVPENEIDSWIKKWQKENPEKDIFSTLLLSFHGSTGVYKISPLRKPEAIYDHKFGNFTDCHFSDNSYMIDDDFVGKFDCKFMGFLDVDLCGYKVDEEDFGQKVVQKFNFNIDKVYFDGSDTVTTKEFDRDVKYMEATLCRLDAVEDLPYVMKKFERLKTKYPKLVFKSSCIDIIGEKKESGNKAKFKKSNQYYNTSRGLTDLITETTFL